MRQLFRGVNGQLRGIRFARTPDTQSGETPIPRGRTSRSAIAGCLLRAGAGPRGRACVCKMGKHTPSARSIAVSHAFECPPHTAEDMPVQKNYPSPKPAHVRRPSKTPRADKDAIVRPRGASSRAASAELGWTTSFDHRQKPAQPAATSLSSGSANGLELEAAFPTHAELSISR